ncbi:MULTISPECIES: GtrA family protein [Anaeromyxobacter]|uniref:GtrA family protein n=1 Tax=Anaeromyxobacter TaxID=161492 RepID=UPI001F5601C5|nr:MULTISPECIES: GtrA family protein [unclassified Anaeromyxobacter]
MKGRLARFALVGLSGVGVNLAALHLFAGVLGIQEVVASALAIETSIVTNFLLNDAFTFRDRRELGAGVVSRLVRYHAVSLAGGVVQLVVFGLAALALMRTLGRAELGGLRYLAQSAGIALAFAANYLGSLRFAWGPPGAGAPRPALSLRRPGAWIAPTIFAGILVLHILPIWLVHYFPTQDGPLHVENVLSLMRYRHSPLLQHWYLANWGAQPNWLTQALLAGLLQVVGPLTGEKLVLTGYTVLFPLGFRALLPPGRDGWWAALAAFPFVHAFPFQMGFWNFCYGLALALLTVGFWLRSRGRLGPSRWLVLALLSVLLFLAHSVAFAGAGLAIGVLLAWRLALAVRRSRGHAARRRLVVRGYAVRAGAVALAALPGAALLGAWLVAHSDRASSRLPIYELAAKLATAYALVSIDRREILLACLVSLVLFIGVVHLALVRATSTRAFRPHDGWLLAAVAFAIAYFAVPEVVAAGAHVSDRFALFTFLCVAAWIATGAAPAIAVRRLALALAGIAVVATGLRYEKQRQISAYVEEYVAAAAGLGPDRVLLPVAISPYGPVDENGRNLGYRVKPLLHATGWVVARNGGVDLKNSQAFTDHCPLRFPDDHNPFLMLAGSLAKMEGTPPCIDLRAAVAAQVDYVLVYGVTPDALASPCGARMALDLRSRYEPIAHSASGMLEIWRPRPEGAQHAQYP